MHLRDTWLDDQIPDQLNSQIVYRYWSVHNKLRSIMYIGVLDILNMIFEYIFSPC